MRNQNVIINRNEDDVEVFILENGKLVEMYQQSHDTESTLGNIYNGKVTDIVNGMQAAFINIGKEKNAFISVKDAMKKIDVSKENLNTNIKMSDVLKVGQKILIQVKKEASENKGARVSTHITLPGKYIVLMPETDIITVSQKVENEEEILRLMQIVKENLPKNFGAIIRTDAANIRQEDIIKDIIETVEKWENIKAKAENDDGFNIIHNDHDIVDRTIRDIINQNTQKVYINDKEIFDKVIGRIDGNICTLDETNDLIEKFGLRSEIIKANNNKFYLNCGGHIVIDKTEALTAIDVNSGKYTGDKDLESTTLKVNLEAAKEIMKQIRLKDIGGIIVIDYIDMHNEQNKQKILEIMHQEAKKDRSKVDVREFTQLNLVEMTRKKLYL